MMNLAAARERYACDPGFFYTAPLLLPVIGGQKTFAVSLKHGSELRPSRASLLSFPHSR
jgi:hypothetical protein